MTKPDAESIRQCRIGDITIGNRQLVLVLGPCVIESEGFAWALAKDLKQICADLRLPWIFKASYDKANRSGGKSFRGVGLEQGCKILDRIRREHSLLVTTDVHSPEEARYAARFIDLLQIPAFLCRQTDLIEAAAQTGKPINVKKGQFLAPWDLRNIADKLQNFGCRDYVFTERGVSFGYNNLVSDMRSIYWIHELGLPVIFDATHSVQRPGGKGSQSGGDGALAPVLARAAVAAGCDAVFIETHYHPEQALSDGPNQIALDQLPSLLACLKQIYEIVR
jgi:2-dehydro-3-deoxyphosphooctonate aldolase (KDO 8-P synthase)